MLTIIGLIFTSFFGLGLFSDVRLQISNDVPFALNVYLGIGQFIAGQLRNANTQQPPKLPEFLRDLANMVETSQAMAANDGTLEPPEPEAA